LIEHFLFNNGVMFAFVELVIVARLAGIKRICQQSMKPCLGVRIARPGFAFAGNPRFGLPSEAVKFIDYRPAG
jgi:hypothetical protein